jgi:BirA family transcriptional regulator, biotin operon repressor / biotin---[acetyl-CoA-carboxylase] ligase
LDFERSDEDEHRLRELLNSRNLRRLRIPDPIYLKTVDSTQLFIANEMHSSREGDIVLSRIQTFGKGRENRVWFSQEGGLWLTLTLLPPNAGILAKVPIISTTAILRTLVKLGLADCSIKPPNDVYCGGKKIAGVLADASVEGSKSIVYLGVGINVNNDPSEIGEITNIATSVKLETEKTFDLIELAGSLIENLDAEYFLACSHA